MGGDSASATAKIPCQPVEETVGEQIFPCCLRRGLEKIIYAAAHGGICKEGTVDHGVSKVKQVYPEGQHSMGGTPKWSRGTE